MIAFMWYMALRKVVTGGEIHLIVLTRYRERNASSFGVLRNRILKRLQTALYKRFGTIRYAVGIRWRLIRVTEA